MLELDLEIDIHKKDFGNFSSNKRIVSFLFHKTDLRELFLTFTILDIEKKELIYISSFLANNEKIINKFDPDNKIKFIKQPHNIVEIIKGESFLCFTEGSYLEGSFIYYVDYKNKKLKIYFGDDFVFEYIGKIIDICPTNYKDPDNKSFFYFSAITEDLNGNKYSAIFRSSLDLSNIENIFYKAIDNGVTKVYHTTRKLGNKLFFSNFYDSKIYSNVLDEKVSINDLYLKALKELYNIYSNSSFVFSKEELKTFLSKMDKNSYNYFSESINIKDKLKFYFFISKFLDEKGIGTIEEYIEKYIYEIKPSNGFITIFDLDTFEFQNFSTTFFDSAHFEVNSKGDEIFVSSHNFLRLENVYYLGNAAIDKFKFTNGDLIKENTFMHETGYRFTSHKVFICFGKEYLCITGHPNRLFFVDAKTMELEYFFDFGKNHFEGVLGIKKYLNDNSHLSSNLAIESIDAEGNILLIPGNGDYMIIFSFLDKKIIDKIEYRGNISLSTNLLLKDYHLKTTHIQYLT